MEKGEAGVGGGGVVTPAAPKKQTRRRQLTLTKAALLAQSPTEQRSENSVVLDLLMDLSSRMHVTEEYIVQCKEAESNQSPARLVHPRPNDLQPS